MTMKKMTMGLMIVLFLGSLVFFFNVDRSFGFDFL